MIRVLVVDDEPTIRTFLAGWLERKGFEVVQAENAEQALEHMTIAPAGVVFCDVIMPGQDGLSLTKQIRQTYPHTAVILETGQAALPPEISMMAGVMGYLEKPFKGKEAEVALNAAVQWHQESVKRGLAPAVKETPLDDWLDAVDV